MANKGMRNIILYSYCCTGQNRNRYILTMLWYACTKLKLDSIEHRFLQTGYTLNEGGSMHSAIEKASEHIDISIPPLIGVL